MRLAAIVVLILVVFLSPCFAEEDHDPAIGATLGVVSGVMTRTTDHYCYMVTADTKVIATFEWTDEGNLSEPEWATDTAKVMEVRLKKIRLAQKCSLELLLTGKTEGDCELSVAVSGHRTAFRFLVR